MPAYKNKDSGSWYVVTQYTDWTGERKPKCKRGFATRREALEWEQKFQQQSAGDLDMSFEAFVEIYTTDLKARLKESTWQTKEHIIQAKILPYFGKRKINEITTKDVIAWQNELLAYRDEKHKPYSQSYLKTLHNQLSAIFNHAVRFYDLRSNPAAKAGNMGSEERKEMLFWTKEEYQKFAEEMMDKPISYYAFQMLYWTGIREGELLALTPADFDFERGTVKISKTYQRLKGKDVITSPKTKKSNRTIQMPDFLCEEIGNGLDEQLENFVREHSNTKLIIIDTMQKIREVGGEAYSYASDYEIIGRLKQFADKHCICVLTVHHTRKQPAGDAFEMISGTTGLLGCADGSLLMQKKKRTALEATIDVVGRDQQDQILYLSKDPNTQIWNLDRTETELHREPPDPTLEAVARLVTSEQPEWTGSPSELAEALDTGMAANALTKYLNIKCGRLKDEYGISYENKAKHSGRRVTLALLPSEVSQ